MKLVLDVGCGDNPKGTVNVDIITGWNPQTGNQKRNIGYVDPKKIPNFVKASGEFLPFRNGVFSKVYAFEVIEHVKRPFQLLKEIIRVSRSKILITCPHRFSPKAKMPYHRNYFNRTWFVEACKMFGVHLVNMEMNYAPLFRKIPISFIQAPSGIVVKIRK